jgi:hypothetical protein
MTPDIDPITVIVTLLILASPILVPLGLIGLIILAVFLLYVGYSPNPWD